MARSWRWRSSWSRAWCGFRRFWRRVGIVRPGVREGAGDEREPAAMIGVRAIHGQYRFHRHLSKLSRWWSLMQAVSDTFYCYAYDDYGDDGPRRGVPSLVEPEQW